MTDLDLITMVGFAIVSLIGLGQIVSALLPSRTEERAEDVARAKRLADLAEWRKNNL